jgi:hypothetical protein
MIRNDSAGALLPLMISFLSKEVMASEMEEEKRHDWKTIKDNGFV